MGRLNTDKTHSCLSHKGLSLTSKKQIRGFPGGLAVKNLPASAGDMGSIPEPGRSHMLWSN